MSKEEKIRETFKMQQNFLRKMLLEKSALLETYKANIKTVFKNTMKDLKLCEQKDLKKFNLSAVENSLQETDEIKHVFKEELEDIQSCHKKLEQMFPDIISDCSVENIAQLFQDDVLMVCYLTELRNLSVQIQKQIEDFD